MNGKDLLDATFAEMKQELQCVGETMNLKLVENETLRSVFTKKKHTALRSSFVGRPASHDSDTDSPLIARAAYDTSDSNATSVSAEAAPEVSSLPPSSPPTTITATLDKGPSGYGLTFGGPRSLSEAKVHGFGVFVSGVKAGSIAEQCPDVKVGWQIISMNGNSLDGGTFEEMKKVLATLSDTMVLVLRENDDLLLRYANRDKAQKAAASSRIRQAGTAAAAPTNTSMPTSQPNPANQPIAGSVPTGTVSCVLQRDEKVSVLIHPAMKFILESGRSWYQWGSLGVWTQVWRSKDGS